MGNKAVILGWAILLTAFLVSCDETDGGGTASAASGLEGIEWVLMEVSGRPVSPMAGDRTPSLKFDGETKQVSGFGGCNSFFSSYESADASLKFGPVGSTRKACADPEMSLETEFFGVLEKSRSWQMRNGELLLLDDGNVIARFAMAPGDERSTSDAPKITGAVWQWVSTLYGDDRKVAPSDPANYTVQFQEDGNLNVRADCNQKGGTYSASPEDRSVSIEITHSTMAACPEGSLEDEFVRGLSAASICFVKDGDLFVDLKYDSGTMRFSRQVEHKEQ